MKVVDEILKSTIQIIGDLNKKAQSDNVNIEELQEEVRVIDMLLHSITRINNIK